MWSSAAVRRSDEPGNTVPVLLGLVPLLPAALIYIGFRPETLIFVSWLESAGLGELYRFLRALLGPAAGLMPDWAIYNLPNGLWAFAVFAVIAVIWPLRSLAGGFYLSIGILLTWGLEVLQRFGLMPGTFDPGDLAMMALLGGAGLLTGVVLRTRRAPE